MDNLFLKNYIAKPFEEASNKLLWIIGLPDL